MFSHPHETDAESIYSDRFTPPNLGGDYEDLDPYKLGGYRPVHLGDRFHDGRFEIVHKLGNGECSTLWLAQDHARHARHRWVALRIVAAEESEPAIPSSGPERASGKFVLASDSVALNMEGASSYPNEAEHKEQFVHKGPNGHHLCLVWPAFGPSVSHVCNDIRSRVTPSLARRAAYEITKSVAKFHTKAYHNLKITGETIVFSLDSVFQTYTKDDIYRIFGEPITAPLTMASGELPGPEAPNYIVRALDMLFSEQQILAGDVQLIDFDQSLPIWYTPGAMEEHEVECLAPEIATGHEAISSASNVWALGCTIFLLRSGKTPFFAAELNTPEDLMRVVLDTLEHKPPGWVDALYDDEGLATKDVASGRPATYVGEKYRPTQSLRDLVFNIWDKPNDGNIETGKIWPECGYTTLEKEVKAYPVWLEGMFWNPEAVTIDNTRIHGYDDCTEQLLETMPKISQHEAELFYDLMSRIFVYSPAERITATEMLDHPWFNMGNYHDSDSQIDKSSVSIATE